MPIDDLTLADSDEMTAPVRSGPTTRADVVVVDGDRARSTSDLLATEEPLEIRLVARGETRTVTVTMRTPGADFELAAGFLHGEQIVTQASDIHQMSYCIDRELDAQQQYNIVNVEPRAGVDLDLSRLDRNFMATSACGVCGKASLDAIRLRNCPTIPPGPRLPASVIRTLPDSLRGRQGVFAATGGLHAAGLFDPSGRLLALREDVGRHNAVDKLIGWALLNGRLPLHESVLMVSGRTSFEILQKALNAGIPIVCAVSAPSSLAVSLAREFGMTLAGFVRDGRFNIYTGAERIKLASDGVE